MAQKEDENREIRLGNAVILYERLIPSLKSEINFLKNQILAKDTFTFLRRQLSEALGKKVDTSAYLSASTIAVHADESEIRSDSKKTNTKEKPNT